MKHLSAWIYAIIGENITLFDCMLQNFIIDISLSQKQKSRNSNPQIRWKTNNQKNFNNN